MHSTQASLQYLLDHLGPHADVPCSKLADMDLLPFTMDSTVPANASMEARIAKEKRE